MSDLAGEAHPMRNHPLVREFNHDIQDLTDHLRIERRCWFVKQHGDWVHGQSARDRHALLLSA